MKTQTETITEALTVAAEAIQDRYPGYVALSAEYCCWPDSRAPLIKFSCYRDGGNFVSAVPSLEDLVSKMRQRGPSHEAAELRAKAHNMMRQADDLEDDAELNPKTPR